MSSVVNFAISKCNSQTIGCNDWSSVWPTFEWKSRTKYSPPFPAPILAAKPFGTIENCLRYPHRGQFVTKNISVQKHSLLRQGIIWSHYHCPSAPPSSSSCCLPPASLLPPSCLPPAPPHAPSPHINFAQLPHWSTGAADTDPCHLPSLWDQYSHLNNVFGCAL